MMSTIQVLLPAMIWFLTVHGSVINERADVNTNETGVFHQCETFKACNASESYGGNNTCNEIGSCGEDHCFVAWRNVSGFIAIEKSGCWMKNGGCEDVTQCVARNDSKAAHGVLFCCCHGNLCSSSFRIAPPLPEEPEVTDTDSEDRTLPAATLISVLAVSMLLLVAVICCGYYVYRKRKMHAAEMDAVSVNTPATGTTGCTVSSFPMNMESPSPHLLAVKARGRFGKVWRAQLEDQIVAVKTFNLSEKSSWQNEQDIFCTPMMNTHPNILKFLTASSRGEGVNSELWLITEFYDRGSLTDYLRANTVTMDECLRMVQTMACGMSFLHEDIQKPGTEAKPAIAHRDFKSKNVLLDHNLNAVIADFGLAVKFLPGESPGESHGQVGTLRYMAPEVLEGAINFQKDAFLRIDMYAFGLVMWEVMTRCTAYADCGEFKMPFEAELGPNPSMDFMQEHVVEKKLRPAIRDGWKSNRDDVNLCETMEECWDHDAEARLSAGCVEQRIIGLRRNRRDQVMSPPLIVDMQSPTSYADTSAMNQINMQMSVLRRDDEFDDKHRIADGTSSESENSGDLKKRSENCQDDDHDSGTFANEDTLSHDGVMEQLLANSNAESSQSSAEDNDSATSLLSSEEPLLLSEQS